MSISTVFLTLALMIASFSSMESVQAMDINSYKNQALTSIRLELWYQGLGSEPQVASESSQDNDKEQVELPEELTVALQKQLAH